MKRLLIFFFALASITAGAQEVDRVGNTPSQRTFFDGRLIARKTFALPSDTLAIPAGLRNYPWVAAIGDVIYLWSPTQLKWIAAGGGGGSTYTFLPPFNESGGVVTLPGWNATKWDSVLNAVRTNVWLTEAIADGRYSLLGHQHDTLDFNGPLYRVGNNVYINYDSALFNARRLGGITIATTAPANGQVLKYNSGSGQWEPAADNDAGSGAADGNNYPTSLDFDIVTGNLTLGRQGLSTLSKNMDGRYLRSFVESDPFYDTSAAKTITRAMIAAWNAKQNALPAGTASQYWNATGALRTFSTDVYSAADGRYIRANPTGVQSAFFNINRPSTVDTLFSAGSIITRKGITINAASEGSNTALNNATNIINSGAGGITRFNVGTQPLTVVNMYGGDVLGNWYKEGAGELRLTALNSPSWNNQTTGNVQGFTLGTFRYAANGGGAFLPGINQFGTDLVWDYGTEAANPNGLQVIHSDGKVPIQFRKNGRIRFPLLRNNADTLLLAITPDGEQISIPKTGAGPGSGVSAADRAKWDSAFIRMEQLNDSTVRFHSVNGQYWDLEMDAGQAGEGGGSGVSVNLKRQQWKNSVVTTYTLTSTFNGSFAAVFYNGVELDSDDYTVSGNTLTLLFTPTTSDRISIHYSY